MKHFPSADIGMFGRRQRHARGARIPVSILIGANGAPESTDTVVLFDTFCAQDVMQLPGHSCTCCTVRAELQVELRRLLAGRAQKHFTRVVIQTHNDVAPILRTFASEGLGSEFYMDELPPSAFAVHEDTHRFALTETAPVSWDAFSRFISALMALRGADLLHVKGLLDVAGCYGPVAVQFMQHLAHAPVELQAWPVSDHSSRIAFTTRNIEEKMVRALFDSVHQLSTSS